MLKRLLIPSLCLTLLGITLISWLDVREKKRQQKIAIYKSKHSKEIDQYMEKYNQWLELSPQEKEQSPWYPSLWNKDKTPNQLLIEQSERLQADMDSLAAGQMQVYPFAHILYGDDWLEKLAEHKKHKEFQGTLLLCSHFCILIGAVIFSCCSSIWTARWLKKKRFMPKKDKRPDPLYLMFDELSSMPDEETETETDAIETDKTETDETKTNATEETSSGKKIPRLLRNYAEKNAIVSETIIPDPLAQIRNRTGINNKKRHHKKEKPSEKTNQNPNDDHRPLNNTLQTIAEQIGAIREYASKQQDTVKRYRDGYDWNIIKNFCLRIIRCIDNIEKRIAECSEENVDTEHFSEIRDELVFTLESSGVERFEPDLHSVYRGQERTAEVVKDRIDTEDDSLIGKIAKVIRPGYQYVIDEENIKIIRPALVKLFGKIRELEIRD